MPDHRIRLRGPWTCLSRETEADDSPEVARRLDLPTEKLADLPPKFRLTRQFGKPPVDPAIEEVILEIRNAPGIKLIRLNGREIFAKASDDQTSTVALDEPLLPRNGLLIEVERCNLATSPALWGEIALVIRPRA